MITYGNLKSPIIIATANLTPLDIKYHQPFTGLCEVFFEKLEKRFKVKFGYIGFEKEDAEQIHNELDGRDCKYLILCGEKIHKLTSNLKAKTLKTYHPSYVLRKSSVVYEEEITKYEQFLGVF